jgi:hypothetical protein
MKNNLFGTIVLIGGVASLTAACSGNPLKPAALNPGVGDGGSNAAVVTLSDPRLVGPALEVCANQPADDTTDGFVAMCDVTPPAPEEPTADAAPAADEAAAEAAVTDSSRDDWLSVKHFSR